MKILTHNLTKSIETEEKKKKLKILNKLNLNLYEGEINLLYGANGSGKTTLALILALIILPTSGEIYYDQIKIDRNGAKKSQIHKLRKEIKILFQELNLQIFKRTIADEIAFNIGPILKKTKLKKELKKIKKEQLTKQILQIAELKESYLNKSPFILSSGQKQKLLIACLLVSEPKFLILDEPTMALDNYSKKKLLDFLFQIQRKRQITILLISHDHYLLKKIEHKFEISQLSNPRS